MKRFEAFLEKIANIIFESAWWKYIEFILLTGLFALFAESITDYDNALYQTWKYQKADRFILALLLVIFLIRKVRLINWQSLVITLIFIPIAFWQIGIWNESPDIKNILYYETLCEWISLMLIADMFIYRKKINNLLNANIPMLCLYGLLAVAMLFHRNGRNEPLYLVFPLIFIIFTEISSEEWEKVIKAFMAGWFIYYVYAIVKSFKVNPYVGGRYYGYFINLGSFGMFLCCTFVVAVVWMIYSREKYGLKSIGFLSSCIWLLSDLFMFWLTNTRTLLAGVFGVLLVLFLFARKDVSRKTIIKRILVVLAVVVMVSLAYILLLNLVKGENPWKYYKKARKGGLIAPIYIMAGRMATLCRKLDTSSTGSILFTTIDTLSSNRLSIIKVYSEYFNFSGNSIAYLEVGDYIAFTAHNNYVQFLVDYGYPTAFLYFSLIIASLVMAVKNYLSRGRQFTDLLVCLWIPMCLGIWLGEACPLNFPGSFVMLFLICRMISENGRAVSRGE